MFVLIDNYDSFTYNLVHFLGELGAAIVVRRNDKVTPDEVMAMRPQGVILSPGPCDPDQAGICLDMIATAEKAKLPVLGVCLGHQAIGQHFGGKVLRAPLPMHGKLSQVHHRSEGLFDGLPSPFKATRYHSLIVDRASLPDSLQVPAETEDGIIMGVSHRALPVHGVQFHPESIASEHGHRILANFLQRAGMNVRPLAATA